MRTCGSHVIHTIFTSKIHGIDECYDFTGTHKKKRSFFTHASVWFTHFSHMRTSVGHTIPYVKHMDSGIVWFSLVHINDVWWVTSGKEASCYRYIGDTCFPHQTHGRNPCKSYGTVILLCDMGVTRERSKRSNEEPHGIRRERKAHKFSLKNKLGHSVFSTLGKK